MSLKKTKNVIFLLLSTTTFFCLISFSGFAQLLDDQKIDSFLNALCRIEDFSGNILIARSGKTVYLKSYGYNDIQKKVPLTIDKAFPVSDIGIEFTAGGIFRLIEQGKLKLTDSIRRYFPELPYYNVNISEMLNHSSGIPQYFQIAFEKLSHTDVANNDSIVALMSRSGIPLDFEPGSKLSFSYTNYLLLASLIEKLSGRNFEDYMLNDVLNPAGIRSTFWDKNRTSGINKIAQGFYYSTDQNTFIEIANSDPDEYQFLNGIKGDGNVYTTIQDLAIWVNHWSKDLLYKTSVNDGNLKPFSLSQTDTSTENFSGYGILQSKRTMGKCLYHDGEFPGFFTAYLHFFKGDLTVIVFSNNQFQSWALADALANLAVGNHVEFPYEHIEIKTGIPSLSSLCGTYQIPNENAFKVVEVAGKLYRRREGDRDIELKYEGKNRFYYSDRSTRQIRFDLDNQGNYKMAYLTRCGLTVPLVKQ